MSALLPCATPLPPHTAAYPERTQRRHALTRPPFHRSANQPALHPSSSPAGNPCYVYIAKQVRDDPAGIPEALDACRAAKRARLTPLGADGEEVRQRWAACSCALHLVADAAGRAATPPCSGTGTCVPPFSQAAAQFPEQLLDLASSCSTPPHPLAGR